MFIATLAASLIALTDPTAGAAAPAPATPPAVPVQANPRVCLVDTPTGSHISTRTCKRLAEWKALGFDPLTKR
jgi:hypothetical protein